MTTIITRLYAAEDHAKSAFEALKDKLNETEINLVTSKSGKPADIEDLIVKGGVRRFEAAALAKKVLQGGSLVTVRAPWGFAKDTIKVLDSHGPVDSGVDFLERHVLPGWHQAAVLSPLLGLPLLEKFKSNIVLRNDPAPYSTFAKIPTLTTWKSTTRLLNNPAPFSSLLSLPTISHLKPFSALVKNDKSSVNLATRTASPLSDLFFLPVIRKD
jgi:hypothetical protein